MMRNETKTVGEVLIGLLEVNGVEVVFGIPGVHTAELYRGLTGSPIRHVTPRHEQGAGFMADGYARVSGKPGVCFVITGPGLTNTITAMAQAHEDSVPMLVISGVNARRTLGKARGHLHELPDQQAMMQSLVRLSYTLQDGSELEAAINRAFTVLGSGRPGPVHLEIPTDVMTQRISVPMAQPAVQTVPYADPVALERAAALLRKANRPTIIAGGGAAGAGDALKVLAEKLDAPVVLTTNARGLMPDHALTVPASPSLPAVRSLVGNSDLIIGVGTQFGPTDFDMYQDGGFPELQMLIRIDIDAGQIAAGPYCDVAIVADAPTALKDLAERLDERSDGNGADRARSAGEAAWASLSDKLRGEIDLIHAMVEAAPSATIVGDSTQLVYAGNMFVQPTGPKRWFNSATGYGALGFALPAAIGAAIADPASPVICIVGDGGLQFSLGELGTAMDERANVTVLVWNNFGYREIESFMIDAGIEPEGVKPSPPDMEFMAKAYGLGYALVQSTEDLVHALNEAQASTGSNLLEYRIPQAS